MFTGMKTADAVLLKSCFADSMVLQTISRNKEGKLVVKNENPSGFIDFVSKEAPGNADERITFDVVKVMGLPLPGHRIIFIIKENLAIAELIHFSWFAFNGEWKIQYLIDTRRKQGCSGVGSV